MKILLFGVIEDDVSISNLDLKEYFNDDELKHAYICLAKKYHFDNYIEFSEKKRLEAEKNEISL